MMHSLLCDAQIIVVKIGSVLIREAGSNTIRREWFDALADDVHHLIAAGKRVVIVSSGGVALGREAMGIALDMPPAQIPLEQKQAASAVGQHLMFSAYHAALSRHNTQTAQVLLTMSETENRHMHLNARATLQALFARGIVPIINENDTVSTGEIRFGDNDRLAVRVAQMIEADLVVLMSTIDGLYTDNPDKNPDAQHIPIVETIDESHVKMAGDAIAGLSTGGMKSKIEAAQSAGRAGIPLAITNGMAPHALRDMARFTLFKAQQNKHNARKTWIGTHLSPKGKAFIDAGAQAALQAGKSLLPIGVKRIEGNFRCGDVIAICDLDGDQIGTGIAAYDAAEAQMILGKNSADIHATIGYSRRDELVHRNDMVLAR